jgi:hypothetical protein
LLLAVGAKIIEYVAKSLRVFTVITEHSDADLLRS